MRQVPLVADLEHLALAPFLRDEQHALLRLAEHDLVRRHPGLAARHRVDVQLQAAPRARRHLHRAGGEPRGAHVLDAHQAVRLEQLQARFEEELLQEGVADLDRGALRFAFLVELGGGHRRAVDAVPPGARADVDDGVSDARRRSTEDAVRLEQAEGEGVHQAISVVALVERHLAADGGNADAVSVAGDARDHAFEQTRGPGVRRLAEPQRVQRGDRARAHGKHVPQDAAHAGRRALVRFDVARVIVALHLERHGQSAAHVDDARVLARPLQDARPLGRQVLEEAAGGLVRAVLGPHRGEDAQLDQVRIAADVADDTPVLVLRQAMLPDDLGSDSRVHGAAHCTKGGLPPQPGVSTVRRASVAPVGSRPVARQLEPWRTG